MTSKLPTFKGGRILAGYRRSLIALAFIMLALDCASIGLFESLMISPGYEDFRGFYIDETDYALLLSADLLTILFFALLAFRPQGLGLFKNMSSRVLTGCRVVFSLALTVLVLCKPAIELETLMELKFSLDHVTLPDKPALAHELFMNLAFCGRDYSPEGDLARMNQRYCQVARAR
ncbi:hypothetical protein EC968_000509 [Mortierella alpina]|nr:hypothetical protein EC968_000509 [Mortierella alpina]